MRRPWVPIAAVVAALLALAACAADRIDEAAPDQVVGRSASVLAAVGDAGSDYDELIVWGGSSPADGGGQLTHNDGARFNLESGEWSDIAPSPLTARWGAMNFAHNGELYVLGGFGVDDGAAWDPETDSWRTLNGTVPVVSPLWDQAWAWDPELGRLVLWHQSVDTVWAYDPGADAWATVGSTGIDAPNLGVLRPTADGLVALANSRPQGFGGSPIVRASLLGPASTGWERLPDVDFSGVDGLGDSSPQSSAVVQDQLVLWGRGGESNAAFFLDAAARTWVGVPPPTLPACELAVPPASNGEVIVARSFCGDAAIMEEVSDVLVWQPVDFPSDADVEPVWTGSEFVGVHPDGAVWRWTR